ncbi:hypothetical protein [Caulobacter sp. RHG1]|uniref:hypothetical protein n=1 Tax=Caulobacter sp. (strain RHG1) TaxID=2545762 RepID=UPI001556919C|nr:hypothetical protein [Caulobacter sp. RHG1]
MTRKPAASGDFAARPTGADRWVKSATTPAAKPYSARLTLDITPALRARIKIIAIERGQTLSDMVRELLEATYGVTQAPPP